MSVDVMKARLMTVMRNLPPLPKVTQKLMAVIRDQDSSAQDVTKVLSLDQTLAAKVLKLVNSSFYGLASEVTTISRAVVVLGFSGVRNLALSFGSVDALQKLNNNVDMSDFWDHSLATGVAAQELAKFVNRRTDPEEAFVCGLMHNIGSYVLAAAVPDVYGPILADQSGDMTKKEFEATGYTHPQVGHILLKFWELPDAFGDAAKYHHDIDTATNGGHPLANLIALAEVIACVHGGYFSSTVSEAELSKLMSSAGVDAANVKLALANMDQKISEMSAFMSISGSQSPVGSSEKSPSGSAVVITTDDQRRQWSELVLSNFGYSICSMQSFLGQKPDGADVQLVLVDYQCLTQQQLTQLLPFLEERPVKVAMLSDRDSVVPDIASDLPAINYIFSRRDLEKLPTMSLV